MISSIYRYIIAIVLFGQFSCADIFMGPDIRNTPRTNFDYLCKTIEERYSLFEIKNIDWDSVKTKYSGKIDNDMTRDELFEVLGSMLGELEDGHVNIDTDWDYARNWDWYLDYPANFNFNILERNYLGRKHWRPGPFLAAILPDSIGYVYYASFAPPIKAGELNALFDYLKNCKAVIFDIRSNGGGKLDNVRKIAERFADTTRLGAKFYYKSGKGKNDFDGPFDYDIKPSKGTRFTKDVVILTNRKSYSASTFFPAIMSAFPHVKLMGDKTGGGGGIPYYFELPNGWPFRFSTTYTIDSKGRNIELGIEPDIQVEMLPEDEAKGVDTMIEKARAFLLEKMNG